MLAMRKTLIYTHYYDSALFKIHKVAHEAKVKYA